MRKVKRYDLPLLSKEADGVGEEVQVKNLMFPPQNTAHDLPLHLSPPWQNNEKQSILKMDKEVRSKSQAKRLS